MNQTKIIMWNGTVRAPPLEEHRPQLPVAKLC